jgi:squalene-hopene/tetraprenyl-beta-curcumene cyclase
MHLTHTRNSPLPVALALAFLTITQWTTGWLGKAAEAVPGKTSLSAKTPALAFQTADNISFRNEIQHGIDRGLAWLTANQNSNGWWHLPDHPAVTALAITAFNGDPMERYRGKEPAHLKRAYDYLLTCVQSDGSICRSNLPTYNTAISLMALLSANNSQYDPISRKARSFLVSVQRDFGEKGRLDTPFDGGFGYGTPRDVVSDMGNTLAALEAMYYSKRLITDQGLADAKDLNWEAAIHFLQSCQNLPSHNKEPWASDDPANKGGFIYHSGRSNAGGETNSVTGRVMLRSYGSISYAGLLSFIYADLKRDDPRLKAVQEWLSRNYTLEENPGLGAQGLFYYYHTMAKALSAAEAGALPLSGVKSVNWRHDLAMKLLQLQQRDGSWVNENVRWWEKEPALVTSYALLSLEMLWRGLGE